jgi:hypothetical protein
LRPSMRWRKRLLRSVEFDRMEALQNLWFLSSLDLCSLPRTFGCVFLGLHQLRHAIARHPHKRMLLVMPSQ